MANSFFNFKQFSINQENSRMKVGTDGVLLGAWANVSNSKSILDIGTGTGLISLMVAQRSDALIIAIEPDSESLTDAILNFKNSKWSSRIELKNTNLQKFIEVCKLKFDHIISNPPYFTNSLLPSDKSRIMARHTDSLSLLELISISSGLLTKKGKLSLILPASDEKLLINISLKNNLYLNRILYIKPTPAKPVKRILCELSFYEAKLLEETICIEVGGRHNYSEEYIELTKEYYL